MNLGSSFRHLLLLLQLALLPATTQGKEVVLGKAGDKAELPCQASQKKNMKFSWKYSGIKVLENSFSGSYKMLGTSVQSTRSDSSRNLWEQGSFPLIIRNLDIKDSGIYTCEVEDKKKEVELLVFNLNADLDTGSSSGSSSSSSSSSIRLRPGERLTLSLENPPGVNPSIVWKSPGSKKYEDKSLSLTQLGRQESGTWECIVSYNKKTLVVKINIFVLAFQKVSNTVYVKEGEKVELSSLLNFEDENLEGELRWQAVGTDSLQSWITFSLNNKKVSVKKVHPHCKLKMKESLPLLFSLFQASHQDAGSGNLTLFLGKGQLHQEVNLVVMRMTKSQNHLICELLGPSSPKLILSLKPENQTVKVSSQQKLVKMLDPEAGTWQCLLSDKDKILLESKLEVPSAGFTQPSPKLLAILLGGILGFLTFTVICIFCCVKCWHRRRQAERMSQIKRLLSEKKTCQCPHRYQKTGLI